MTDEIVSWFTNFTRRGSAAAEMRSYDRAMTGSLGTEAAFFVPIVLTIAGLIFAVIQWRQGLAEKALDGLYQRIALANQMRLEAFKGLEKRDEREVAEERPELYRLFVYTEIDSLEYVLRRYRSALTGDPNVVHKAITQFERRCHSETFSRMADECLAEGAYFDETRRIVQTLLDEHESRRRGRIQSNAEDKPVAD